MFDVIVTAIGALITGVFGLIGWVITMIFSKLNAHTEKHENLANQVHEHRIHVAQNFVTKVEVREVKEELMSVLTRIEDKLDRRDR